MIARILPPLVLGAACAHTVPTGSETAAPERTGSEADARAHVTVLYVADLHGQLTPHPELFWGEDGDRVEEAGGLARIAAAVRSIREEHPGEVLFLDAGDTFQGSGVAALSEGEALLSPLSALELDGAIPGNWEVAYGPDRMRDLLGRVPYPVFAANVRDEATGERLFAPWLVKDVGDVRVAVVGFTDPDVPERQPPIYSTGLRYDGPDELPELVRRARAEEGADVVLLMSHIGLSKAVALSERVPGVDVHLSSDTHERTYEPVVHGDTWTVEPGAFGSFLGRLDLWVEDGRVVERQWELIELTASRFPEEDPEVAARVVEAAAPHAPVLDEVVGHTADLLARYDVVHTKLDAVLADALREATGTEIALSNGFRFGTPLLPGPVRQDDLWAFYPVVTNLKKGRVTGAQLRAFWERELENVFAEDPTRRFGGWVPRPSGMTLTFEAGAAPGQRVREIRVGGDPLDDDRVYTITACEREGDAPDTVCRIPGVQDAEVLPFDAHEAVRRYLAHHPEVRAPADRRVTGLDLPPVLRTQH